MKRVAFISGSLFSCLAILGTLFKIMHWPGAGPLFVLGLAGTAVISIPFIALHQYNKNKGTDKE